MKHFFLALLIIVMTADVMASDKLSPDKLHWMIGQIVTTKTGDLRQGRTEVDFFSTGFIVKTSSKLFFITTAHTLEGFRRKYGHNQTILVALPSVPAGVNNIYKAEFLFSESTEDSAVLKIEGLQIEGDYETPYMSPRTLDKGTSLIYMGYSAESASIIPRIYHNRLLSCAVIRNGRSNLGCETLLPTDTWELYSAGDLSSLGLSGSPVFSASNMNLIGILKAIGDDTKDARVSAVLGVKKFNVIRPLDKTISRIKSRYD
jgi:hypothetical protein